MTYTFLSHFPLFLRKRVQNLLSFSSLTRWEKREKFIQDMYLYTRLSPILLLKLKISRQLPKQKQFFLTHDNASRSFSMCYWNICSSAHTSYTHCNLVLFDSKRNFSQSVVPSFGPVGKSDLFTTIWTNNFYCVYQSTLHFGSQNPRPINYYL